MDFEVFAPNLQILLLKRRPHLRFRPRQSHRLPGRAGLFLCLVLARIPQAQEQLDSLVQSHVQTFGPEQIAPPVNTAPAATAAELANPSPYQVFTPPGRAPARLDQPFQFGAFVFHPHITYRYLYGTGLESAPGHSHKSSIQEVLPGLAIDLGTHWVVEYNPTLRYYSDPAFQGGVDQNLVLHGEAGVGDWQFGLAQVYTATTAPTLATGSQVSQTAYATSLTAGYVFDPLVSLALGVNQNFNFASGLQSTREWSTLDFVDFNLSPRLLLGVGGGGGYDSAENSADQTFQQFQTRVSWLVDDRLSVSANAGLEDREFAGGSRGPTVNPIYGAQVQYQPFAQTQLALKLNHSVSPSVLASLDSETATYELSLNQRLLGKLHLNVTGGYNRLDFLSTQAAVTSRSDYYYTFTTRLSLPVLQRGTVGLEYRYAKNASSAAGLSTSSNQVGVDLGFSY